MTTNEVIRKLFLSFAKQDKDEFYRLAEEYINLEDRKKHNVVVRQLKEALHSKPINGGNGNGNRYKTNILIPRDTEKGFPLLEIKEYIL